MNWINYQYSKTENYSCLDVWLKNDEHKYLLDEKRLSAQLFAKIYNYII